MEPVNPGELSLDVASEPTLADRLKALQVQKPTSSSTSTDPVPVPTNSLASALIQALHSSDSKLLESCLVHSKSPIVTATVKRLPTHLVVPLVDALVERLGRGRRGYGAGEASVHATRARALMAWLKCVLVVHIAHLISVRCTPVPLSLLKDAQVPGLVNRLSSLYKTVQARLELQEPLLALSGRLELVVSQIELRREARAVRSATREEVVDYVGRRWGAGRGGGRRHSARARGLVRRR
jgi:U3 small nucleolar RNA-associated protein 5